MRLDEAVGLARAIALDVVAAEVVRMSAWRPGTLLGAGTVKRLAELVKDQEIAVTVSTPRSRRCSSAISSAS